MKAHKKITRSCVFVFAATIQKGDIPAMSSRKFHALFFLGMMILAAMFTGGCGGSSGGSDESLVQQNPSPTPITSQDTTPEPTPSPNPTPVPVTSQDTTPTPSPTPTPIVSPDTIPSPSPVPVISPDVTPTPTPVISPDPTPSPEEIAQSEAEYALSRAVIGYKAGDNPNYVTQNLTLPSSVDALPDVTITWTSNNPSAISATGNVNRQADNTNVTLTAKAVKDSQSAEKNFDFVVIRQRSRTVEQAKAEIKTIGVTEIRAINASNDELQITYTASRDRVTDIDGKYTDMTISTADDALDAVQSLHGILGINAPYEELEASVITSDAYGAEYTFSQVYDGVRVFGRNVTVSANSADEGDFIASSVVPSAKLAESNLSFTYTKEQAENSAKEYYLGSFDVRENITEKLIFTLENYENNPVPAYVVNVCGTDNDGVYYDKNLFVNASNGEVIYGSSNIYTAVETRTARNEMNADVNFPVINVDTVDFMIDPATKVRILEKDIGDSNLVRHPVNEAWNDRQQISAYTNMIEIMKWWKASFDRNSIDGCGMTVDVVTHLDESQGYTDNAAWCSYSTGTKLGGYIEIGDPSTNQRSQAAAIDVLAHESTHGVLTYQIGRFHLSGGNWIDNFPYNNDTGAINEGYADIFGCLKTR